MIATRTAMVISLGIFLGLLNYGIQTTLVNYNCLVNPERPLKIISVEKENGEVNFLGENFTLSPESIQEFQVLVVSQTAEIKKMAGDIYKLMAEEYHQSLEHFRGHL